MLGRNLNRLITKPPILLFSTPQRPILNSYFATALKDNSSSDPSHKKFYQVQKFDEGLALRAYTSLAFMSLPYVIASVHMGSIMMGGTSTLTDVFVTRNLLRWSSLHIAINGGVHYGLAEIKHEVEQNTEGNVPYTTYIQAIYSFFPAISGYFITTNLLFGNLVGLDSLYLTSGLVGLQIGT